MNKSVGVAWAALFLTLSAGGCAGSPREEASEAPAPVKTVDEAKFYSGRWYEIGRTPMKLTKDCVAGTTDYYRESDGQLIDRDACRSQTPEGKEKLFTGRVEILNPGQNNKVTVRYRVAGVFYVPKTYWMLDHGKDYTWFIVSDPSFQNVSIFTRSPRPTDSDVAMLTQRTRSLGYNPDKLEFPTRFPEGEGQPPAAGAF